MDDIERECGSGRGESEVMKPAIAIAGILALLRVWIGMNFPPDSFSWIQVYKDVAHLFVGGLFGAWLCQRMSWQWTVFWFLCAIEILVAIQSRV